MTGARSLSPNPQPVIPLEPASHSRHGADRHGGASARAGTSRRVRDRSPQGEGAHSGASAGARARPEGDVLRLEFISISCASMLGRVRRSYLTSKHEFSILFVICSSFVRHLFWCCLIGHGRTDSAGGSAWPWVEKLVIRPHGSFAAECRGLPRRPDWAKTVATPSA
jgi:hypothetical protein